MENELKKFEKVGRKIFGLHLLILAIILGVFYFSEALPLSLLIKPEPATTWIALFFSLLIINFLAWNTIRKTRCFAHRKNIMVNLAVLKLFAFLGFPFWGILFFNSRSVKRAKAILQVKILIDEYCDYKSRKEKTEAGVAIEKISSIFDTMTVEDVHELFEDIYDTVISYFHELKTQEIQKLVYAKVFEISGLQDEIGSLSYQFIENEFPENYVNGIKESLGRRTFGYSANHRREVERYISIINLWRNLRGFEDLPKI